MDYPPGKLKPQEEYATIQALYEKIEFLEEHLNYYKELLEEHRLVTIGYKDLVNDLLEFKRIENDE